MGDPVEMVAPYLHDMRRPLADLEVIGRFLGALRLIPCQQHVYIKVGSAGNLPSCHGHTCNLELHVTMLWG